MLSAAASGLEELMSSVEHALGADADDEPRLSIADDPVATDFESLLESLRAIELLFRARIEAEIALTRESLAATEQSRQTGAWAEAHAEAVADAERYRAELAELGVDPEEYDRVRSQLAAQSELLTQLDERIARLPDLRTAADDAWRRVEALIDDLRSLRQTLLDEVAARSQMLRFSLAHRADVPQWVRSVRELLNLRADGFLPDVPALGEWLWTPGEGDERERRAKLWREACVTGDFGTVSQQAVMRAAWAERLSSLDPILRARLGSTTPDDTVEMQFLTEGGDPDVESD
jgi:hypothetical protein